MAAITVNKSESVVLRVIKSLYLPLLGIVTALVVGALIIAVSGFSPLDAYSGLLRGAFGDFEALNRTLAVSTPYLFTALAVIVTFRAGLFSIGAEGQLRLGAIATAAVGIPLGQSTPPIIAVPVSVAAGCLVGALWGAIPGVLRAYSGASEVIVTIMLNYIAGFITGYLVGGDGPLRARSGIPQTASVGENARIPNLFQSQTGVSTTPLPLHWGFIVALVLAVGLYFVIRRTPFGFEIRTVGANPNAARYAGISVKLITIVTMTLSGLIAAFGGSLEILGSPEFRWRYDDGFGVGYGFDSIAIALLARNNPLAVIPAAILIGALKNGATAMQFNTTGANGQPLPGEIISIVQALVIIFVSADQVLRWLYRIRVKSAK